MAKRISVINFKGGVGKTTLSFQLAAGLVRYHAPARVLVVDMDHQSSLSIVCLGATEWNKAVRNGKTINEVFKPFIGQSPHFPGKEIISLTQQNASFYSNLKIVPASLQLDDIEIELTASHHGNAIQSEWNKRTLICRWLESSGVDRDFDYIIFDCPPATKIVSQNAIAASHGFIIPVIPEAVMERGAPHLFQMVQNGIDKRLNALAALGEPRALHVPNTQLAGVAVTRIKTHGPAYSGYTDDHTQHLTSLQRSWGNALVTPYIEDGTGVSQTLAEGVPVYDRSYSQNVGQRGFHTMYKDLTASLKQRIDALQMRRLSKASKANKPLTAAELGRFLKQLAGSVKDPSYGNTSLSEALLNLSLVLTDEKYTSVSKAAEKFMAKGGFDFDDEIDFSKITSQKVLEALRNPNLTRAHLAIIGVERFGIARSRLEKMPREEIIKTITAALEHETSLKIIATEAQREGKTRTS